MTDFTPFYAEKFACESCDFKCCKKSDWSRHVSSRKHKRMTNDDNFTPIYAEKFGCACGKQYKYRQGLWCHLRNSPQCANKTEEIVSDDQVPVITNELIISLINQNKELQNVLMEQNNKLLEIGRAHV